MDDVKKLTRVMQYIRGTNQMTNRDCGSTAHLPPDVKSHTGISMTLGSELCASHHANRNSIRRALLR